MVTKKKSIIINIIFTALVILFIGAFSTYLGVHTTTDFEGFDPIDDVADMTDLDIENTLYRLNNRWALYPEQLLYPGDFKDPEIVKTYKRDDRAFSARYGTYRVFIKAKPNTYLELAGYSIDYGMRVFVDGKEILDYGYVADNANDACPGGGFMRFPLFTGEDGVIELIYQYSNFFHNDNSFIQQTFISSPKMIDNYVTNLNLSSILIGGGLFVLGIYFLINAAVLRNLEYFSLSLCSFIIAVRNQYFYRVYVLPDGFDFELSYKLSILIVSLIPMTTLFLIMSFFGKAVPSTLKKLFVGASFVLITLHFVYDSHDMVDLCHYCYYASLVAFLTELVYIFIYFLKKENRAFTEFLTLAAIIPLVSLMVYEALGTGRNENLTRLGTSQFGLLICMIILAIVINMRSVKQAMQLQEEKQRNQVLGQINTMNRDFLQNVAHELKTPLTVISGYAQLMELQAERGGELKSPERLKTIRSEADRLGEIVTKLMDYTYGKTDKATFSEVDCVDLLKSAAAILRPVCLKRNNELVVNNTSQGPVYGNFELLLQVIINLVVNASKHTDKGNITIKAFDDDTFTVFEVIDTGTGISPEDAPHIFERGYTKDGGTGLGLAICSDTISMHGGTIGLEKTGPDGTTLKFTVPKMKKDN